MYWRKKVKKVIRMVITLDATIILVSIWDKSWYF